MMVAKAGFRHYLAVLLSVTLCVGAALTFAIIRGPLYTSSMVVKAADEGDESTALKKLASLGGIGGLGGNGFLPTYIELLQSNQVAQLLIKRDHFDQVLYRDHLESGGRWRRGPLGKFKDFAFSVFGIVAHDRPTVSDVQNMLVSLLVINQDQLSGLVTIGCTSSQVALCREVLLAAHREAEYSLTQERYRQAIKARDYLLGRIANTPQIDVRESLGDSLAIAQNRIAMSGLERPVAAVIIESPIVPDEPSFPKPITIAMLGLLAGLAVGLALAVRLDQRPPVGNALWRTVASH